MKIHEFQAKQVLRRYGVAVPAGGAATDVSQAVEAARTLPGPIWVVKSQLHAGGRGKGRIAEVSTEQELDAAHKGQPMPGRGGVQLARSLDQVGEIAGFLLGNTLVTKQTGREGRLVRTIYVEAGLDIDRELYLGVLLDRAKGRICVMASKSGGTEIEEVAAHDPSAILKEWVDPAVGLSPYQGRKLAFALGLTGKTVNKAVEFMQALYRCYLEMDCSMVEVNPLVITKQGDVLALDCKMSFDDNALFRHPDLLEMRDVHEEDPAEVEAAKWNLSYVKLDGNIGCMVNGAGLAMSTMDIIQFKGAVPANFLDVGGGANAEQVAAAFRIITSDPNVKGILVNIFGGIMRGDVIAEGVISAVKQIGLQVPLVVRLVGTNAEQGRAMLRASGLNITPAETLDEAADAIVAAVK